MSTKTINNNKIGRKTAKIAKDKSVTIKPFEDEFSLSEVVSYQYGGREVGALLLKKGTRWQVVFGFSSNGITNIMTLDEIDTFFDPLETGLRDFLEDETLTIHQSLFRKDKKRANELNNLIKNCPHPKLQFFLLSETKKFQEIEAKGWRQNVNLNFYCTYTFDDEGKKSKDPIENILKSVESSWLSISGNKEEKENQKLKERLQEAYTEGFERWFNLLDVSMGLGVKPHTSTEIWQKVTSRLVDKEIEIPQLICLNDNNEIYLEITSELDPIARIYSQSQIPVADNKWVFSKNRYIGAMAMQEKEEGWKNKLVQLQTMWKAMSRQELYDLEVFCQIQLGDIHLIRENMSRLTKQAINDNEQAKDKNDVDIRANLRQEKAMEAQRALLENQIPLKTAVLFLVHRPDLKTLDRACNFLAAQFSTPLELYREDTITYELWLQTLPIYWNKLLRKPFDRSWMYSNAEIQGIMPLVQADSVDKEGIEFISSEGGIPIYLDLWNRLRHTLILATSRGGKGILLARIIINHLARGIPVSIMDYPNPDGTGTYVWLAQFLGEDIAAYFNTASEACNIFELPDLSSHSEKEKEIRMTDFKEFLLEILFTMVVGSSGNQPGVNVDDVRTILSLAIEKFYSYDNLEIKNRFVAAYKAGFGTPEWNNTPVLQDFIDSLGPERLKMPNATPQLLRSIEFIRNRLRFWQNGRIGKAISRPSTIKANSLLVVYALANLSNAEDATIMTLAINMMALRKSLEHKVSVMLIDEVSVQVRYEAIAKMIGQFAASGLKNGISLLLAGQDINSIAQSKYASNILDNIEVQLIGRIKRTAINSMVEKLEIPREIISQNASKKFYLILEELATHWLMLADERLNVTRYYADPITLAAAANNPAESQLRNEVIAQHDNEYIGLEAFANKLIQSYQQN